MDIMETLSQINPSMWVFLGVVVTAGLAYFSTRNKHKNEGAVALTEASVSLMEQYRLANEECQEELTKERKKTRRRARKRKKS